MKKGKLYVKKNDKTINNNQDYCNIEESSNKIVNINNESVIDKIEKLFNINGYIFNKDVEIITINKKYNTRIAGKVNNHLITMDNDIINILDIKDIKY